MSELKRTILFDAHVAAGATMVDFGGWDMPIQYPNGILSEHLYCRSRCGIFDVSHMGRLDVEGPDQVAFLQHVLSSNVLALDLNQAQYAIIPDEAGGAVDDAYLYRFEEGKYFLVINAGNIDKDLEHLYREAKNYRVTITNVSDRYAAIAVQGPESRSILKIMSGGRELTDENVKNALNTLELDGRTVRVAKTGYTGEPLGYEVYCNAEDARYFWDRLISLGARPTALGARDTLRMEAALPLYGHEMGECRLGGEIPVYAVPLAKFAVSFAEAKGDFVGRAALLRQFEAFKKIMNRDYSSIEDLPYRIQPICLLGKGVLRAGCDVYDARTGELIGYVTSGTMIPYYETEGTGLLSKITENTGKRSIGMAYMKSNVVTEFEIEVDIRGKRVQGVVPACHMRADAPPYTRPILYKPAEVKPASQVSKYLQCAAALVEKTKENHVWRQERCINLIPSEMTPSRATRLLYSSDPAFRYAEHKKQKAFYDEEIFYYQGTKFIGEVEDLLVAEMKKYLCCTQVETRCTSGQMSNTAVFSAMMDFKNRVDRKSQPQRLGWVMNNHIVRGGHLSAQPMGAFHDYIAVDPVTEKQMVVNFPVCVDNPYRLDVEAAKKLIDQYRPEFLIFGKSMVLCKEPVAEIRKFVDEIGLRTTIMYDMAHVMGLVGDYFQKPFEEGAEIVTGSTHKTFFGPQRGLIGVNWKPEDLKWGLWETIETRTFPGSVSNHHLGTLLGQLMAAYEMNAFKDEYQKNVIENAKHFARCLKAEGLDVAGDPAMDYTETHQVIVKVGYSHGPEVAERLEENNIICNYQATPEEEGFTASGALRLGVSEMTRFGFGKDEFAKLAALMAACIRGEAVGEDVARLRAGYTEMKYCFSDRDLDGALENLCKATGL
ncbi:MAG: glycine cleavage system aminomethyltransferase GcvT [Oscillospiraceae bacterium]|nr:glycine cleavage system aminomethyltransferase GcvT [Oscillospiraceae bacterium]